MWVANLKVWKPLTFIIKQDPQSGKLLNITYAIVELPDLSSYYLRMHTTAMERQCDTPLNAFQSFVTSKNLIHVQLSFLESLIQHLRVTSQDHYAPFLPASELQGLI